MEKGHASFGCAIRLRIRLFIKKEKPDVMPGFHVYYNKQFLLNDFSMVLKILMNFKTYES